MKITIEQYDTKVSLETKHEDVTSTELLEYFTNLMHAVGFLSSSINESLTILANDTNLCDE